MLWTVAFLALLVGHFTMIGRTEARIATNLRANAVPQAAADGAVQEAIFNVLQGLWAPDRAPHLLRFGNATAKVTVRIETGKVNPNTASAESLQALLRTVTGDARTAAALAASIVDWRSTGTRTRSGAAKNAAYQTAGLPYGPAGRLFDSVDEVGFVIGMTPDLMARLHPLLSVFQDGETPGLVTPAGSDGGGRQDGWIFGSSGRVMVVVIEATAAGADGARMNRQSIVRLRADPGLDQAPYQILTWDRPEQAR